jgi:hypothetical protein
MCHVSGQSITSSQREYDIVMSRSPSRAHHVGASLSQLQPETCRDAVMMTPQVRHLMRLVGCAMPTNPTTMLTPAFGGGHPTPDADFIVGDGMVQAFDAHRASVAVRLGFDDEPSDAFFEEQVA